MRETWRAMHSREPNSPASHCASTCFQEGSAKRSSKLSVTSSRAIVPSKSQTTLTLINNRPRIDLLPGIAYSYDTLRHHALPRPWRYRPATNLAKKDDFG